MSTRNKVAGGIINSWGEGVAVPPVAEMAKKLIQPHWITANHGWQAIAHHCLGFSVAPWHGVEATPLLQPNGPQRGRQRSKVGQQHGECDPRPPCGHTVKKWSHTAESFAAGVWRMRGKGAGLCPAESGA